GLNQIMQPFFRHNSGKKEDIAVLFQSVTLPDQFRFSYLRTGNSIWDKMGLPSVIFQEIFLHVTRQDDNFIRVPCSDILSKLQHSGSKISPFRPLPVQSMDGCNHPDAKQLRNQQHDTWSLRVKMNHVITSKERTNRGQKGIDDRIQGTAFGRGNRN